jgi:lysyl-tRNA synthetase class 2
VLPAVSDVRYLYTSPEFPMKRLLAAGSGDIYQICKVFRADEAGRCHSPEFTLLEWYRLNLDHFDLMNEVEALLGYLLEDVATVGAVQRLSYRDAFHEYAGFDALTSNATACAAHAARLGIENDGDLELRQWLELIFSETIVPACARHGFTFIYDFPADQAALARVRPGDPPLAERFELIGCGLELANGFHELADVDEQRERFERELSIRQRGDAPDMPIDEHLLAALAHGLPDCAGVALGLDRLVMLATGVRHIGEAMAFSWENA